METSNVVSKSLQIPYPADLAATLNVSEEDLLSELQFRVSISLVVLTLLLSGSLRAAHAQPEPRELRGVWLTTVASNVMNSKVNLAAAMDSLQKTGINAVFPVVFWDGHTVHPSEVMQELTGQAVHPSYAQRDVLADIIAEAHLRGIEVHPWLEYGFVASHGKGGGPILQARPEWAGKRLSTGNEVSDDNFHWMSQAHPEVQQFLIDLATEIIENYDVDGIHLDRIRYGNRFSGDPNNPIASDFGYDDAHVERYRAEHDGADPPSDPNSQGWRDWRARVLSDFHQAFYDSSKARNPHVMVSNAPVSFPWGYTYFMQDWRTWAAEGSLDFIAPQYYRFNAESYDFEVRRAQQEQLPPGYDRLYPGILVRSGDYQASESLTRSFLEINRDRNVAGEILWFFEGMYPIASMLRDEFYQERAIPPYREFDWRPPAIVVSETAPTVERIGTWNSRPADETPAITSFDGHVLTAMGGSGAALRYSAEVVSSGYYDVYAFVPYGLHLANNVPVQLLQGDRGTVHLQQRNEARAGWTKLTTFWLDAGTQELFEIGTGGIDHRITIAADAAMLKINRKLSPGVRVSAEQEVPRFRGALTASNFPNPFRDATTITFELAEPSHVTIIVFDVLGRRVSNRNEGFYSAGSHEAELLFDGVAPGVYFGRIESDGYTQTVPLSVVP